MIGTGIDVQRVRVGEVELAVATAGDPGSPRPPLLLVHGFPHTWQLWSAMLPDLARDRRVIAPDLRGLGGSSRAAGGYDARTQAGDLAGLLDRLGVATVVPIAIDLGVPVAFQLALDHPDRVERLVLAEAVLPHLPGAEHFGPPWWFGFHRVPGLAETVVAGHEAEYLDFFWQAGTRGRGLPDEIRAAFLAAYRGEESLRCAFEHYRAAPVDNTGRRLAMPTLAVGAHPVGDTLHRQLVPVADDLTHAVIPDCGHIIPLDRPSALLELVGEFLTPDTEFPTPDTHKAGAGSPASCHF